MHLLHPICRVIIQILFEHVEYSIPTDQQQACKHSIFCHYRKTKSVHFSAEENAARTASKGWEAGSLGAWELGWRLAG